MTPQGRRAFLLGAVGIAGAGAAAALPAAARSGTGGPMRLLTTYVAGLGRHAPAADLALSQGQALALRREPKNPYDARAVSIWTEAGARLGYVPRIDNQALANLMDAGVLPEARISAVIPSGGRLEVHLSIDVTLAA